MDTNVHPSMTLRLVDALIKAEKDFDMLVLPDAGHAFPDYAVRRSWDYFVKWLRDEEPPKGYRMMKEVP
jgi:dipeptidyl-peptidase 4